MWLTIGKVGAAVIGVIVPICALYFGYKRYKLKLKQEREIVLELLKQNGEYEFKVDKTYFNNKSDSNDRIKKLQEVKSNNEINNDKNIPEKE